MTVIVDLSEELNHQRDARRLLIHAHSVLARYLDTADPLLNDIEEWLGKASDTLPGGPGPCE